MRESRLQVFKGMATKATRDYMGGVFAKLKPEGYRMPGLDREMQRRELPGGPPSDV